MTPPTGIDRSILLEAIGLGGVVTFLESGAPGMLLAAVRGEGTLIQGYGETKEGNGQEPGAKTMVRLCSITKAFTGECLAGLAADGKVRLTDPLRCYAQGASVPKFGDREITLLDLATHSASLPREMGSAPPDSPPFTWPTRADRWAWLAKYELPWAPGSAAAYSNVGFDLLADALSVAAGKSYADVLQERITGPLGMADTTFTPTKKQCAALMTGSGVGGAGPCVSTEATWGSGGLYSTAHDMALWLRHNLSASDSADWPALKLAHAVYSQRQEMTAAIGFDDAGPMAGLAMAWVVMNAQQHLPTIVQKSGGGGGFMGYIAFAPGRNVGVFAVVNRVNFGMFASLTGGANAIIANLITR